MLDVFNSDAFSMTSLAATLKKVPYRTQRLGPGGLALFDEKPIATTSIAIEEKQGQLSIITTSPRGTPGAYIGDQKAVLRSFVAQHLSRKVKVMADEVQGVRVFGSENETLSIEQKVSEKLAILQAMHELTWEYHRVGALIGSLLDADGTTELLNMHSAFGVSQQEYDIELTDDATNLRVASEAITDLIDDELGGTTYDRVHCLCGGTFYDELIAHPFVQDVLKALQDARLLSDLRSGFTLGGITYERAKRWKVKNAAGTTIEMIGTNVAYAFPVGAFAGDGPMFIGRFAPQPFLDTVNRLNPPLVVKSVKDPNDQFVELTGVSCPLYLNTRPRAVVKLTKS